MLILQLTVSSLSAVSYLLLPALCVKVAPGSQAARLILILPAANNWNHAVQCFFFCVFITFYLVCFQFIPTNLFLFCVAVFPHYGFNSM